MISAVIPTLLKDRKLLVKLLKNLEADDKVSEIIVINNSQKDIDFNVSKLRIIEPKENIFVNPAWNLGVKESKSDIVVLLNDDIIIPDNFCTEISKIITSDMGILGMDINNITETHDMFSVKIEKGDIKLKPVNYRPAGFGVAMFFFKTSYSQIPEQMLVYCGDDWIVNENKKNKKQNYLISGQKIIHYGSLSSGDLKKNTFFKNDIKEYKKLTLKWYHRLCSLEETTTAYKFRFLGITLRKKKSK